MCSLRLWRKHLSTVVQQTFWRKFQFQNAAHRGILWISNRSAQALYHFPLLYASHLWPSTFHTVIGSLHIQPSPTCQFPSLSNLIQCACSSLSCLSVRACYIHILLVFSLCVFFPPHRQRSDCISWLIVVLPLSQW